MYDFDVNLTKKKHGLFIGIEVLKTVPVFADILPLSIRLTGVKSGLNHNDPSGFFMLIPYIITPKKYIYILSQIQKVRSM